MCIHQLFEGRRGVATISIQGASYARGVGKDRTLDAVDRAIQTPLEGHELYRRYVAGDENALAQLIAMYKAELTHHILNIVKNPLDADELLDECFVRLGLSGAHFKNSVALRSYLFTIGKNLALNRLKHNKRRHETSCPLEELLLHDQEDEGVSPEGHAIRMERKKQLLAAIEELKASHRDAIRYVYFENLSYQGAAEIMDKSPSQIADIIYRAKIVLRKKLERNGFIYADE